MAAILAVWATYELVFTDPNEFRLFYNGKELVVVGLYPPTAEKLLGLRTVIDEVVVCSDKAEGTLVLTLLGDIL